MDIIDWAIPSADLELKENEVHLWCFSLNKTDEEINFLTKILSEEEIARANKFVFKKDKFKYIVARAALKNIISSYLSTAACTIYFSYNKYGKPYLEEKYNHANVSFNLSHSGDFAVCAITKNRKIGVDIENINAIDNYDGIVQGNFSEHEKQIFGAIPEQLKRKAFITCWTRKEAYIKAHGKGLSFPLDQFGVSFFPGEDAKLLFDQVNEISEWSLKEILSGEEYIAAVAVEGKGLDYCYYKWQL